MADLKLPIDLRSDTVTRPTPDMRKAMANAEVGDDVYGDDPTVNRLQERAATLLGKEASLFVPSGTMANQLAIRVHTQPGDEIIAHKESHVYFYEVGAPAAISGCSLKLLDGARGQFDAEAVAAAVRPIECHYPLTSLVIIENTHNRGGGTCWPIEAIQTIRDVADRHDLRMHLDGARLMNACVAKGVEPTAYSKYFDTVSICFSKGLGAPVGSIVAGTESTIRRAHRFRKMFGGGMRQVGIIAAGALFALDHHVERLADDHANARRLAEAIADMPGVTVDFGAVQTNIVFFDVDPAVASAEQLVGALKEEDVWISAFGLQRVRAVTCMEVTREGIDHAIAVLRRTLKALGG
ncbi:MAG: low-specificity L-threonine aldolase [Planctomycetes bacterium]|nr:low-specificity L-threonine aldolase [Planctomycetota bacterium]